ncbi:MAG: hypothetical protein U1C33_00220, partial [Candidatus Cloacimonadaceae bacterium]|nr:hypothetical protein [Candidatus Cloacimonadaceae bacterium]
MKTYSIRLSPVLTDLYKLESWLLELPIPENTDTKVLALVAEEAFSNIVLHGFEDRPANSDGYVDIEMGFMDNGLTMRFVDNG